MSATHQQLKQLLKSDSIRAQLDKMVTDAATNAAMGANEQGLRSQLQLLSELSGWGADAVLRHLQAMQAPTLEPESDSVQVSAGQGFVNLKPEVDTDNDDNERVTPAGHLWLIESIHEDGTIHAECAKTGGWIFPCRKVLASNFIPAPVVYDAGADQVERYTVFPSQLGFGAKEVSQLQYLGCSEGGRAVSMFGELTAREAANGLGHLGEKVSFDTLSEETRLHIVSRLREAR